MVSLTDYAETKRMIYRVIKGRDGAWGDPVAVSTLYPDISSDLSQEEFAEGLRRMMADGLVTMTGENLFISLTKEGVAEANH